MDRQHRRLAAECKRLRQRVAATERHTEQLENTLCAVAREAGDVTVSHPCTHCEQCFVIARNGRMYCPECGYGRSI